MADLHIARPITLRCGLTLPNRLVKASMSEGISTRRMLPDERFRNIYRHWAEGGWGMVVTGNVQVDDRYLGTANDLAVDSSLSDDEIIRSWKAWADVCSKEGTPTLMQLNHPGRQCPIGAGKHGFFGKNVAPSALGLDMGKGIIAKTVSALVFGTARKLIVSEIDDIIKKFVRAARLAFQSGFAGIELHGAHGYLIDLFLCPRTNQRSDAYGGTPEKRAKFLVDIIKGIRAEVPSRFCVGIVLNSVHIQCQTDFEDRIKQLELITSAGVDFIHISGGTFENPTMFLGPEKSEKSGQGDQTKTNEAFFIDFARAVRPRFPDIPFIVTGGFRTREIIEGAVADGECDIVGLVRPAAVNPLLPKTVIFNREVSDQNATLYSPKIEAPWIVKQMGITALNVHMDNAWYLGHVENMSKAK